MKRLIFNYRKSNGEVSTRDLLAFVTPGNKYAGIDMSPLTTPEVVEDFTAEAAALHNEFMQKMTTLQAKYDLKHNYRQFLESGVSMLEEVEARV